MINTLPTLKKPTYTLLDDLNLQIKYFKGLDILTYYTPSNPTKDKEPLLNYKLQKENSRPKVTTGEREQNCGKEKKLWRDQKSVQKEEKKEEKTKR